MIYILLPAYNEELTLPPLLDSIHFSMEENRIEYKIIVVNDGSSDGTAELVSNFRKKMPIELITHEKNKGFSEAVKTGLVRARDLMGERDIVITMDADNTHSPGLILHMVRKLREGSEVVIASRYREDSRVIGVPLLRKFLSYGASIIFRILFPIRGVKDYTSGYRGYSASILKKAFDKYGPDLVNRPGFSCMVDILLKIRFLKPIVTEVPLVLRYDQKMGLSKMNVKATILETFELIFKRLFRMLG
jgi:dolichol-phosphate mannosyltransferase